MAKKLFPNEDAIGQHIRYTIPPRDGSPNDMEVIGVVNTHRHDVQNDTLLARLFVPFAQGYNGNVFLHVRLNALATGRVRPTGRQDRQTVVGMIPTMRQTLRDIDADLPVLSMAPFVDLMERSVGLWIVKLGATLFGAFGGIALLLAVVGVYGVKAYAVACRTREIGIRMALGAGQSAIFRLIVGQAMVLVAISIGLGLVGAFGATRLLNSLLYGVGASDPLTFGAIVLLVAVVAFVAAWLPARRASRVDPIIALRSE